MRLFHGTDNAKIARPTVLTLGVFDGLHLGHQLIMRTVVERARLLNAVPTAITFDPHPRAVLHPTSAPPLLQTFDQKIEAFGVLHSAVPGNDYCNGYMVAPGSVYPGVYACLCDCLHVDDVAVILAERGLDKRPEGK